MREYGQVQSSFWQSEDAQGLSDQGKLLAVYLLTGPHTNGIGCFKLPDGYVMADLGWSQETVSKGFEELSRNGFANRFDGVVFVPNFLRWNSIANSNIAKARLKELEPLPKGRAKVLATRAMLEFCSHWSDEDRNRLETVTQTVSKGYGNQNQTRTDPTRTIPTTSDGRPSRGSEVDPIWHTGLAFLKRKGIPEPQARSLLGKVKKAVGDVEAAAILQDAESEDVSAPAAWILAAAKARAGSGKKSKTRAAIEELENWKNELGQERIDNRHPKAALPQS